MEMKHNRFFVTLLFLATFGSTAFAQMVTPVDFMRNNPRYNKANPAFYTPDFGYFDLLLGGFSFGIQNIGLKYDNFFQFNEAGQPVVVDFDKGVASLRDVNYLNSFLTFDIFNCGRRTKHGYFTYTHRLREMESLSYNKEMFELLAHGNANFLGDDNPATINLGLSSTVYQEFSFGYQMCLTEQLNIGARLKFLMGFLNAKTDAANLQLYTDPTTYALRLVSDINVSASIPYQITVENGMLKIVDARFNPSFLFRNFGGGIDLGAEYKINDQWGVAAAVNDLGFISWSNYSYNLSADVVDGGSYYQDDAFVFGGLTNEQLTAILNDSGYALHMVDSLMGYVSYDFKQSERKTTSLHTNFMVRGYYDLTPTQRFSAQFTGYNLGLGIKPALTLAYTGSYSDKYDVVVTYTMMPGSYDNLGLGLSANFGGILLFAATNNVIGFFNPTNISQIHIQMGLSFTSGDLVKRAETVVIRDQNDEGEEQ